LVGEAQGMPISLKLIHEVLASAGGLATLLPTTPRASSPPSSRYDWRWLRVLATPGEAPVEVANEPCGATVDFFARAARALNDSHSADIAAFVRRLCEDPIFGGSVLDLGVERPPIDTVHVAYGVGLETRLQTSFVATTPSFQTPPYFVDKLGEDREAYERPTMQWVVNGSIDEVGLHARRVLSGTDQLRLEPEGRSGDDTVPYASLAAAHDWLGAHVEVSSIPLRTTFTRDEIFAGRYDREARRAVYDDPVDQDDPRVDVFETADVHRNRARRTSLMEMHGVSHRGSAQHPVFVDMVVRRVRDHVRSLLETTRELGLHHEDLLKLHLHRDNHYLAKATDFEPSSDADCLWSFAKSACAYPSHCEYRYHVGDLALSQSCRLKRHLVPQTDEL